MSDEKDDKEKWEMPKPVFQSSEGALPRSLEETISHSFIANADTIEIDEDDDILSIMDTPYKPEPPKVAEFADGDKTIEIDREAVLEVESEPETTGVAPEPKPIVVTAKNLHEKTKTVSNTSRSGLFVLIVIVLIVAAVIAGVLFKFSQTQATP